MDILRWIKMSREPGSTIDQPEKEGKCLAGQKLQGANDRRDLSGKSLSKCSFITACLPV
jgi:hypothetical protein